MIDYSGFESLLGLLLCDNLDGSALLVDQKFIEPATVFTESLCGVIAPFVDQFNEVIMVHQFFVEFHSNSQFGRTDVFWSLLSVVIISSTEKNLFILHPSLTGCAELLSINYKSTISKLQISTCRFQIFGHYIISLSLIKIPSYV